MKNIFKTFKDNKRLIEDNKRLLEENKILKAQNESLVQFRENFDKYYHDIFTPKIIERKYDNVITLNGSFNFNEDLYYLPIDECKKRIVKDISNNLMPYVEFDVVDNDAYGTKTLVGRLSIATR